MKQTAILLAALLAASASQAQVYVGGAVGSSRASADCSGVTSCKNTDTGSKFFVGYDFGSGFAAELGYVNFGKFSVADTVGGVKVTGNIKPAGLTLGGAYYLPLGTDWSLPIRLGVANMKTKVSATGTQGTVTTTVSQSETKTEAYVGLGVAYALSPAAKLELGFDSTRASIDGDKGTVRMFTLGLNYKF